MDNQLLLIALASVSILTGLVVLILLRKQRRHHLDRQLLEHQLGELKEKIEVLAGRSDPLRPPAQHSSCDPPPVAHLGCEPPIVPPSAPADPSLSLEEDELSSRLASASGPGEAPERYRHVSSLVERGLSAEEISRVLHISAAEAEQLIVLSRVSR